MPEFDLVTFCAAALAVAGSLLHFRAALIGVIAFIVLGTAFGVPDFLVPRVDPTTGQLFPFPIICGIATGLLIAAGYAVWRHRMRHNGPTRDDAVTIDTPTSRSAGGRRHEPRLHREQPAVADASPWRDRGPVPGTSPSDTREHPGPTFD